MLTIVIVGAANPPRRSQPKSSLPTPGEGTAQSWAKGLKYLKRAQEKGLEKAQSAVLMYKVSCPTRVICLNDR